MKIEIYHASKFGNGAMVAEELRKILVSKGHEVGVHHIRDSRPKELSPADLYVFGSPTRFGKPIGSMRRFTKKASLQSGTKYALFATHGEPLPDKKTGLLPTDEKIRRARQTIPILDGILKGKGLVKVADKMFIVTSTELRGHLKEGWQAGVQEFAAAIS